MSTKNSTELIHEVAAILGLLLPGEALSNEDHQTIDGCIDPVLEEVEEIVVVDRGYIPGRYFQTIARLTAAHAAAKFSNATVDLDVVKQHEQRLRVLVAQRPSYQPLQVDYF